MEWNLPIVNRDTFWIRAVPCLPRSYEAVFEGGDDCSPQGQALGVHIRLLYTTACGYAVVTEAWPYVERIRLWPPNVCRALFDD